MVRVFAPAKVNLYLKVVGKREDGYHLLDTLMVPVSLGDDVELTWGGCGDPGITLVADGVQSPPGEENITFRAARLYCDAVGARKPITIRLYKRIPVGAGLGGGSSDAAATLLGLNALSGAALPESALMALGVRLGADVPFFIAGKPARARGIGDELGHPGPLPRLWMILLYPEFEVSTAWVYRNFQFKLTKPSHNNNVISTLATPEDVARVLVNDLESVTMVRYPGITRLKQQLLEAGALGSLMSGSGSSVFGIFATQHAASEAFAILEGHPDAHAYLVSSLT